MLCRRLLLLQFLVLAPALLGGAVGALLLDGPHDGGPALLAVVQLVEPRGEQVARRLAVLLARPRRLALDDDARGEVFELDGGRGFVLEEGEAGGKFLRGV